MKYDKLLLRSYFRIRNLPKTFIFGKLKFYLGVCCTYAIYPLIFTSLIDIPQKNTYDYATASCISGMGSYLLGSLFWKKPIMREYNKIIQPKMLVTESLYVMKVVGRNMLIRTFIPILTAGIYYSYKKLNIK